jgi:mRNA-degrading endonuclease RelE of RelBE toxin-antitoxin system
LIYTVRWKRSALDRLTELWLDASDRASITAAVDEIDQLLGVDPHRAGESRSEYTRVLFVPPIGVFFDVNDATNVVEVLKVWTF